MSALDQASYKRLRDIAAERTRQIIVWVGAGLSASANLPSWSGLRQKLEVALEQKANLFPGDEGRRLNNALHSIKQLKDLWLAFGRLKKELGDPAFIAEIKEALKASDTAAPPSIYRDVWQLPIRGIVSLNLDRFAARSYLPNERAQEPFQHFGFKAVTASSNPFNQPKPFIVQLHGNLDLSETWVLTNTDLSDISQKAAYSAFVNTCFNGYTVLFLGITADDIAVGGHLERFSQSSVTPCTHFWVTDRHDHKTDRWAAANNVEQILYQADTGHTAVTLLVKDLHRFVAKDDIPEPVTPDVPKRTDVEVPAPEELRVLSPDDVRRILNENAAKILEAATNNTFQTYEVFCKTYQESIHRCWFVTEDPPDNELLGYTLEGRVETGGFGTVFRARDKNTGDLVAIKLLRPEVFAKKDMLQSFRRGVRSMRILTMRGVVGVVRCRGAFELPTAVVMDWVDGPDLDHAVRSGFLSTWPSIIHVARNLAKIIRDGHILPERVLHRDLRPKNVMLSNYYNDPDDYTVTVLDFDLSWHQGAVEQSVTVGRSHSGYLAPEQVQHVAGVSTRNAGVDAFGFGMTLFFTLTGRDPLPSHHLLRTWEEDLNAGVSAKPNSEWTSLPARFSRLIQHCTQHKQSLRWDFSQILFELERLHDVATGAISSQYSDLLAEELVARATEKNGGRYSINENTYSVNTMLASGMQIRVTPNESLRHLELDLTWNDSGSLERRNVGKYVHDRLPSVRQQLTANGWEVDSSNYAAGSLAIRAHIGCTIVANSPQTVAEGLKLSLERLSLT